MDYDFDREKKFSYKELNLKEKIEHIAEFISGIWQIHPFSEGTTRTVAVFTIKYLKTMGFDVNNDFFEQNSKYFRDALVRANYQNLKRGISYTKEFLNKFFENMLFQGTNDLDSKYLIIFVEGENVGVKTEDKVMVLIKESNNITIKEMADKLGKSTRSIERAIQKLKKNNKLIRIGSDKTGTWQIL